jgi:hypothetical protein
VALELKVLQAYAALEGDPNFKVIRAHLEERLKEARDHDQVKEEVQVRWAQGRAQAVSEILTEASTARRVLQNMK